MPFDDALRSRAPAASSALLTAALGGLMCFTTSCSDDPSAPADTGVDTPTSADVRPSTDVVSTDTQSPRDAVTADASADVVSADAVSADAVSADAVSADTATTDAVSADTARADVVSADVVSADVVSADVVSADTARADVATATDASTPMDAAITDASTMDVAVAMDATAADAADVVRGRDAPCDIASDRVISRSDAVSGMTLARFTEECNARGGIIEIHPHCGGMNTCGGISFDEGTGILTEHNCQGLNTCTGYSCVTE